MDSSIWLASHTSIEGPHIVTIRFEIAAAWSPGFIEVDVLSNGRWRTLTPECCFLMETRYRVTVEEAKMVYLPKAEEPNYCAAIPIPGTWPVEVQYIELHHRAVLPTDGRSQSLYALWKWLHDDVAAKMVAVGG